MVSLADSPQDGLVSRQVTQFVMEQQLRFGQEDITRFQNDLPDIVNERHAAIQPTQVGRDATHDSIKRHPLFGRPVREEFAQAGKRQRL